MRWHNFNKLSYMLYNKRTCEIACVNGTAFDTTLTCYFFVVTRRELTINTHRTTTIQLFSKMFTFPENALLYTNKNKKSFFKSENAGKVQSFLENINIEKTVFGTPKPFAIPGKLISFLSPRTSTQKIV